MILIPLRFRTLLSLVETYSSDIQNNGYLKTKLSETKQSLLEENFDTVDESTVTRFMLYSRLKEELEAKE